MLVSEFVECLPMVAFVELGGATYYTKEQELDYNGRTYEVPIEEILNYEIDGETVRSIVEDDGYQMLIIPSGSGGQSSGNGEPENTRTFKFNHASDGGGGSPLPDEKHFPSEMNDGEKFQSVQKAINKFHERTKDAEREYAIAVDENGYVHQYVTGGSVSVSIRGRAGQMIVHNHPFGGGNFSDGDMLSIAQGPEKGIVATTSVGIFTFTKGSGFNPTAFSRAIRNARPRGTDYNDAIDKWLSANQKKYHYTYSWDK